MQVQNGRVIQAKIKFAELLQNQLQQFEIVGNVLENVEKVLQSENVQRDLIEIHHQNHLRNFDFFWSLGNEGNLGSTPSGSRAGIGRSCGAGRPSESGTRSGF